MADGALIERDSATSTLQESLDDAREGTGSLLLVAGEAGVGKTRVVEDAVDRGRFQFLRGAPSPAALAYEPVVAALRGHLRVAPEPLRSCGPLQAHLALLLPELGEAVAESDRPTLFEAVRCGFAAIAAEQPTVVLLDDLQISDSTTLELLASLAPSLPDLPLVVIGAYRSDEVPRAHPLRRLRNELRRAGLLREIALEPLSEEGTAALAARVLGESPSQRLARTLHDRTAGVPFFVEELAHALEAGDRLQAGDGGLVLALDDEVPLPQTVRDAVLLRTANLSEAARATAEAAAVAGPRFETDLLTALGCEGALEEVLATALITENGLGGAEFRHPLARDAIYEDIPWLRRRSLHRELAIAIEARGGSSAEVAAHRLAARDTTAAIDAMAAAVDELAALHAYRDAARIGRQALGLWPEGERGAERIQLLEKYAWVAGLGGELAEAGRAQREVVAARRTEGAGRALADAERSLAAIYELEGDRDRALKARCVAADAYSANGLPGEAAAERLIGAGYLQSGGRYEEAAELTAKAGEDAARAERTDLRARALGLGGVAAVKGGEFDEGMETIREGLALALEHGLSLVAAEVYQRLGTAHEIAGDYASSRDALSTAIGFCETDGGEGMEYTCLSCLAYVLRELGDWNRSRELCDELMVPPVTPAETLVADGVLGSILAFSGDTKAARPLLERCFDTANRINVVSMGVDSAAALAVLSEQEGDDEAVAANLHFVIERWSRSEDHHYAVWGLRWGAAFFAQRGDLEAARACSDSLSSIAARTGHPDVLAALAHALGETSMAEGEPDVAAEQMERAAALHQGLDIPFERAHVELRAGALLGAAGRREAALEHLARAHSTAVALGATPIAARAAEEVTRLGASVSEHLGRRAAADHEHGGLSRRELEVVRLVAAGRTNREIAGELVLSTRTVDMHVRNILTKLRCKTRTEAAGKAGDLGLLV